MAIAFDASGNSGRTAAATASYSHTCAGSNRILFAITYSEGGAASNDVTAITYNGVAMTLAASSYASGQYGCNIYYLIAPATGANTLSASFSTTSSNHAILGLSYTGAQQSGQPDATTTDRTSGNATLTLTTIADNCWAVIGEASGRAPAASTNVTQRSAPGDGTFSGDSNGIIHPAGSFSMSLTEASGGTPGRVMVSFAPLAGTTYTPTYTESITTTATLLKSTTRPLTESITTAATLLKSTLRLFTDSITNTDTFSGARVKPATLTELVSVTDTFLRSLIRVCSEAITTTSTFLFSSARTFTQSITMSDTLSKVFTHGVVLIESITNTLTSSFKRNGTNVIWTHIDKSAATMWTKATKSAAAVWTHFTKSNQ